MIRDNYLDISRITADPGVLKIFKIIRGYGGVVRLSAAPYATRWRG